MKIIIFILIQQMHKILAICCLVLFITIIHSRASDSNALWPLPLSYSYDPEGQNIALNPCQIRYIVQAPASQYVFDIIDLYLDSVFQCERMQDSKVIMNIVVRNTDIKIPTQIKHEAYSIVLRQNYKWELTADYYPGFMRGIQTFSQLFQTNQNEELFIKGLPVIIDDVPQFKWRGIMIDTSRHFLPVETILKTIDIIMYAKMNVLHWHITDQDSFPLFVPEVPELSQFGKIGGVYTQSDIKEVISYAFYRGIRVVPQIDTPAHTQSWARSQKYKDIALKCNDQYNGQLDPTIPLTMQVLQKVLNYINRAFDDDYVHFGGDEVDYDCWEDIDHIKEYMKNHNISDPFGLSVDFRKRQKKLWRNISQSKKVIYWANQDIDLPLQKDDVLQWWGVSANVHQIVGRDNEVILSNYDLTYLDKGFGEREGQYGDFIYQNWRLMYKFQSKIEGVNVIGGEVCMWNQVGNRFTHEQKVAHRANILAERLWNDNIKITDNLKNIALRLTSQGNRLRQRGLKIWPVTVGLCQQIDMGICFS